MTDSGSELNVSNILLQNVKVEKEYTDLILMRSAYEIYIAFIIHCVNHIPGIPRQSDHVITSCDIGL